jgi:hypothetical protein
MKRAFYRVMEETRETEGIFGINCMVSAEIGDLAREIIRGTLEVGEERGGHGVCSTHGE